MKDLLFILAIVLLFCVCVILLILHIRSKKKIRSLSKSIEDFICDGTPTEFATDENSLAHLQNNICDLENLLIHEREFTKREAKKNTEFISDISHQLKTPLAGLRLYCEMAHNAAPDSHTEKELALIGKMEKLIYNVLRLEKIRSDTYVMHFVDTQLSDLLAKIKAEFSDLFPQKVIEIHGDGYLRCDQTWLREAIGNIVKNACEHTADDGRVDIYIEPSEKSVTVIIEDNGGGVPQDELPLLFGRFHRSPTASPESTGIGLAVARAITEKHHGTLSAENGAKGLRIYMLLPKHETNVKL